MEVAVSSTIKTVSGGVDQLPYIPEFETQARTTSSLSWDSQSVRLAFGLDSFCLPLYIQSFSLPVALFGRPEHTLSLLFPS